MTATKDSVLSFEIPITIKVSAKFLEDIIVNAIEGGFGNSWFPVWRVREGVPTEPEDDTKFERRLAKVCKKAGLPAADTIIGPYDPKEWDRVWNSYLAWNVSQGGTVTIFEDDEETGEPLDFTPHVLTRDKLLQGLSMVLTKYPHLAHPEPQSDGTMEYDLDAIGADAVIQCAILGDLVYG